MLRMLIVSCVTSTHNLEGNMGPWHHEKFQVGALQCMQKGKDEHMVDIQAST